MKRRLLWIIIPAVAIVAALAFVAWPRDDGFGILRDFGPKEEKIAEFNGDMRAYFVLAPSNGAKLNAQFQKLADEKLPQPFKEMNSHFPIARFGSIELPKRTAVFWEWREDEHPADKVFPAWHRGDWLVYAMRPASWWEMRISGIKRFFHLAES